MDFDAVLISARKERMLKQGYWQNKTIMQSLHEAAEKYPEKEALVSFRTENKQQISLNFKEILAKKMMWCLASYPIGGNLACCILPVHVLVQC